VSSVNLRNIQRAYERSIWGFWDREAGEKQRRNWRPFIRVFNRIQSFDHVVFQIARTGEMHGVATVKRTYYDDQTPIWDNELAANHVIYPWRIELALMAYSEQPIQKTFIRISDYVDGYGIGELPQNDLTNLLEAIATRTNVKIKLS